MELNLTPNDEQDEKVLYYLQNNASEVLASKINNGTPFEKDGKLLTNKKSLLDFAEYACKEAQSLSKKGAKWKMVDDQTVYGWAIHFFEEDSIVGTLYNDDGTEYKPVIKHVQNNTIKPNTQPKKPQNIQFSLFDNLTEQDVNTNENEQLSIESVENDVIEQSDTESKIVEKNKTQNGSIYEKYQAQQEKNQDAIIAYRLGDFYEVLGENAVTIAREIDLTLTSRDCGLQERVPMIGFPYHAAEIYFAKIAKTHNLLVVETDGNTRFVSKKDSEKTSQIDYETGEILGDDLKPNDSVISMLFEIFGNTLEVQ